MTQTDDRELLRALLRIVGYDAKSYRACEWRVYTPPGIEWVSGTFLTEAGAWDYIIRRAPKLLHSVDAAMGLPWPTVDKIGRYDREISIHSDGFSVVKLQHWTFMTGRVDYDWIAYAPTLARALCEVFYQRATAQKEVGK